MRYACLGGGKRFRPFLVVESAALFAVPRERALMAAAALECVHCYSLVHDDLPAMDNDDLRRGRPTVHKAFDEATAILVGDSLLTFAFDILSRTETHPDAGIRIALVRELARGAGLGGMAGGQMLDLAAEGRFAATPPRLGLADVEELQAMKTGALLRFACLAGAILGGADDATPRRRSTASAPSSGRPSRSPTIFSTSRAMPRRSARRPARMPKPTRRPPSRSSASPRPSERLFGLGRRGRDRAGAVRRRGGAAQGRRTLRRRTAGLKTTTRKSHARYDRRRYGANAASHRPSGKPSVISAQSNRSALTGQSAR